MDAHSLEHIGPYSIRRFVDEESRTWLYEAHHDDHPDRAVSLHVVKPDAENSSRIKQIEDEWKLLEGLQHPNLLSVHDLKRDAETGKEVPQR